MHVLTKIFIVLVSLLAVLLVPLVVTYAHNENSYQAKYQDAEALADSANARLAAAEASTKAAELQFSNQVQELTNENFNLRKDLTEAESEVRRIESDLASAKDMDQDIRVQLATLSSSVDAAQKLNGTLVEELRDARNDALASQRRRVELDEALREAQARLDVAEEARRGLEEELQRLRDEYQGALADVDAYAARYGALDRDAVAAGGIGTVPTGDINLDCFIVEVRRSGDKTLVTIDAGSLDGIKAGWEVPIGGREGYVGTLRITDVDLNRSVGQVEYRSGDGRQVELGDRVLFRSAR